MASVDVIARGLGAKGLQEANRANDRIDHMPQIDGMQYLGAVSYYKDLPDGAQKGDVYTVKYSGESGEKPDGQEYVWGPYEGTDQWVKIGKDYTSLAPVEGGTEESLVTTGEKYVWNHKQDAIDDLQTIREGAALGATALQSVPSEYVTETELSNYHDSSKQDNLTAGTNIQINNNVISATFTEQHVGDVVSVGETSGSHIAIGGTSANPTVGVASGYSIPSTADQTAWSGKQDALVSGTNIKTINGNSILGSGNINTIPVVVIEANQVVTQDPLTIQLTQDQFDVLDDNFIIQLDATDLGLGEIIIVRENSNSYIYDKILSSDGVLYEYEIDDTTLQATVIIHQVLVDEITAYDVDSDSATSGQVLTADGSGGASWTDIPKELPSTLGTAGQVLKVNSGATGVEWANESSVLPACPTSTDGTFILKCTVSSGVATYSWVLENTAGYETLEVLQPSE